MPESEEDPFHAAIRKGIEDGTFPPGPQLTPNKIDGALWGIGQAMRNMVKLQMELDDARENRASMETIATAAQKFREAEAAIGTMIGDAITKEIKARREGA